MAGRPPIKEIAGNPKGLTVRLSKSAYDRIDEISRNVGVPKTAILRLAVDEWLANNPTLGKSDGEVTPPGE